MYKCMFIRVRVYSLSSDAIDGNDDDDVHVPSRGLTLLEDR